MKKSLSIVAVFFMVLVGCQQDPTRSNGEQTAKETGVQLVQAADGSLYSVDCLRQNAGAIQAGASISKCKVVLSIGNSGESRAEAGKFFYGDSYASIYYPPTFYNPTYSPTTYSSSYTPYNDNNFVNNLFCNYIFGAGYALNCYYLFGYSSSNSTYSQSYSNSYNPTCEYCLYAPYPGRCRNRCYKYDYVYTY